MLGFGGQGGRVFLWLAFVLLVVFFKKACFLLLVYYWIY